MTDATKTKVPSYKPHETLTGATFDRAIPFAGTCESVQLGRNCDSIVPARLEPDGTTVAIDRGQRADGVRLRRKVDNLQTRESFMDQVFVPWANVIGLQYGPARE